MNIRTILATVALTATAASALAVPAKPGLYTFTQPDGTEIVASLVGDEHFHYYVTEDGRHMLRDADGYLREATLETVQTRMAKVRANAIQPGEINRGFPTTGTVRGLIILAEFQDVKFQEKTTRDYIDKKVNSVNFVSDESIGSVNDYFREQSRGVFTPEFDVVGPVTLPQNRAYYGVSEDLVNFYRDACIAADEQAGADFTRYDVDNDGFVDFVFVIFAGHGEAQGGPYESIWPAMMDMSSTIYDYFDGMCLQKAACACELKGGSGTNWDGVGTICHEFSHVIGLPDIYDARNSGGYGMGDFDMMDHGTYNANSRIPSGYTSMDKYTLGWLEPTVLSESATDIVLEPLIESNKAYFIVNPENENEYYTLENRQLTGFDAGLPGHGLLISLVHYDEVHWRRNTVNSPTAAGYEHVMLIAADNDKTMTAANQAGDTFPGAMNVTSFSNKTTPTAIWHTTTSKPAFTISNIRESEDGLITFDFWKDSTAVSIIGDDSTVISGGNGCVHAPVEAMVYSIDGTPVAHEGLAPGIYVVTYNGHSVKVMVR